MRVDCKSWENSRRHRTGRQFQAVVSQKPLCVQLQNVFNVGVKKFQNKVLDEAERVLRSA